MISNFINVAVINLILFNLSLASLFGYLLGIC